VVVKQSQTNPGKGKSGEAAAPTQPLSGKEYAVVGLVLLLFGIGLLIGFVLLAPRLLTNGLLDQVYYPVIILFGLVAAVVLFGVMKSYASLTVKQPGILLQLGGPAVVAVLVVFGGIRFVPRVGSFNVVVRPHAEGLPIISSGRIRLEYGANPAIRDLDSSGDAEFREIPHEYAGQTVRVLPDVEGYERVYQTVTLDPSKRVIDLPLTQENPTTKVSGRLAPPPKGEKVRVLVADEKEEAVPDEYGRFEITVHKKSTERARFSVWIDGKQVYDDYQPLSGEVTLVLKGR
jgi:hypothetical protein